MGEPAFHDHFSSLAAKYAEFRPTYPPELFAWIAAQAPARALVWDCACGNGQASRGLAEHFDHVIATDASEAQLAAAKPHPKVEYRVALAEASGLPAHAVDAVTVAQAAHWFKHDAFYAEVKRVLRPGGLLAVWTYDFLQLDDEKLQARISDFHENVGARYWPPERAYVEAQYRTLPFPAEREIPTPKLRMTVSWNLSQLLGYFRSWSAIKNYIKANGNDPVEALTAELTPLWGAPNSAHSITFPLFIRAARF